MNPALIQAVYLGDILSVFQIFLRAKKQRWLKNWQVWENLLTFNQGNLTNILAFEVLSSWIHRQVPSYSCSFLLRHDSETIPRDVLTIAASCRRPFCRHTDARKRCARRHWKRRNITFEVMQISSVFFSKRRIVSIHKPINGSSDFVFTISKLCVCDSRNFLLHLSAHKHTALPKHRLWNPRIEMCFQKPNQDLEKICKF
jgi:hypothetical protein